MSSALDNSTQVSILSKTYFTWNIKFGFFVALEPPALICNFLLLYYLIADRTLRGSRHHHSVLSLLIVSLLTNLIDAPRMLQFLNVGSVTLQTNINCLIWQWCDYMLYGHSNVLLLWVSIERYLDANIANWFFNF